MCILALSYTLHRPAGTAAHARGIIALWYIYIYIYIYQKKTHHCRWGNETQLILGMYDCWTEAMLMSTRARAQRPGRSAQVGRNYPRKCQLQVVDYLQCSEQKERKSTLLWTFHMIWVCHQYLRKGMYPQTGSNLQLPPQHMCTLRHCKALPHTAAQHSAAQRSMAERSATVHGPIKYSTAQHCTPPLRTR